MKRVLTIVVSTAMCLFVGSGIAFAEHHEESEGPSAVPVETWTCSYNDGKGPSDLKPVIDEWNAWMDGTGQDNYFAAVVTPAYYGEGAFDVGWLGAWIDGHAMGSGTDLWLTQGGDVAAKFNEVLTCETHSGWVSMQLRKPPENDDESDNSFVLSFSNCSFEEGKTFEELTAAQTTWNAYADENGINGGAWMMFQVYGQEDGDYDFKYVTSTDDFTMLGANWQKFSDGHWRKSEELFDDLLDCDVSRIYSATAIREIEMDD